MDVSNYLSVKVGTFFTIMHVVCLQKGIGAKSNFRQAEIVMYNVVVVEVPQGHLNLG